MEIHSTRQLTANVPHTGGDAPIDPGGSDLARQARGYADVARRARENCQQGHSAEAELLKRRNRSGQ